MLKRFLLAPVSPAFLPTYQVTTAWAGWRLVGWRVEKTGVEPLNGIDLVLLALIAATILA